MATIAPTRLPTSILTASDWPFCHFSHANLPPEKTSAATQARVTPQRSQFSSLSRPFAPGGTSGLMSKFCARTAVSRTVWSMEISLPLVVMNYCVDHRSGSRSWIAVTMPMPAAITSAGTWMAAPLVWMGTPSIARQVGRLDRAAEPRNRCQPIDQLSCTAPATMERRWRTSFGAAPAVFAIVTRPRSSVCRPRFRCSRMRSWALASPSMVSRHTTTTYGDSRSRSVPHGHCWRASPAKSQ
uniref:Uncharacterized protein n=1 Tax=Rhodococcus hoagii TaxID=43767 RepID=Q9EU34_RHOHA|nr:unknown [Prescottella equi]BAB16654.1 hypothetical protein [Prescottella equi]